MWRVFSTIGVISSCWLALNESTRGGGEGQLHKFGAVAGKWEREFGVKWGTKTDGI